MNVVTVRKDELLGKLRENRKQHRAIFEEAVAGYKAQAIKLLEEHIERIKSGKVQKVYVSLPEPEDHTRDYDRVIEMLMMHTEKTVKVEEDEFQAYVMDDWTWKRQFLTTNSAYSVTAARLSQE